MARKKSKKVKKGAKAQDKARSEPAGTTPPDESKTMDFGGFPDVDLKKILGCG